MKLIERRKRYFAAFDRGLITQHELTHSFLSLLLNAPDDATALLLCRELPDWFREAFSERLEELAACDYRYRIFVIGDSRTEEQVEADAARHQAFLKRMASQIQAALK